MGSIVPPDQWKPQDSTRNHWTSVQRDMGGVVQAPDFHTVAPDLLGRITFDGALNECARHDGRTDALIGEAIAISKGYMSKLMGGVWSLQMRRLVHFMQETNCIAPLQVLAREMGCELTVKNAAKARIERLEAELAEARRAA